MNNTSSWGWRIAGLGLLLAAAAVVLVVGSASATQTGVIYSGTGDWIIDGATTLTDEAVAVTGNITITSTFTMTNGTITFLQNGTGITVNGPGGGMSMAPGTNRSTITTSASNLYWSFVIQNTTSNVDIQNATLVRVLNGVTVNGGTAASRYFAYVTVTQAKGYGFRLTDSWASLFKINVTVEVGAPTTARTRSDVYFSGPYSYACPTDYLYNSSTNPYYGYTYSYRCYQDSWTAQATGVSATRGGVSLDGLEVRPSGTQRVDIAMDGGYYFFGNFSYYYPTTVCYKSGVMPPHYWYIMNWTFDYATVDVSIVGAAGIDANFALVKDVILPAQASTLDVHWNLVGIYRYEYRYCGYTTDQLSDYPDYVYSYNKLSVGGSAVAIKYTNTFAPSYDGLNATMSFTNPTVTFTSDWTGTPAYQGYFLASYVSTLPPTIYALWSADTYTTTSAAAVTTTDLNFRNSVLSGAGVRFDRTFAYLTVAQPANAADTIFRGAINIDNVTATNLLPGAVALSLTINASTLAPSLGGTNPYYDYRVRVTNSTFQGGRSLYLGLLNNGSAISTNYTADIVIEGNTFRDANGMPTGTVASYGNNIAAPWRGVVYVDTGWHAATNTGDWYQADVMVRNNTFVNDVGTLFVWPYSDYTFQGGSRLTFEGNTFRGVSAGVPLMQSAEMIKTIADVVTFRGNTFDQVSFTFGILGGFAAGAPGTTAYYSFALCAAYIPMNGIGYAYWYYGCSWPMKTPVITIDNNLFNKVSTPANGPQESSFLFVPGHGTVAFTNNTITNSSATFIRAGLHFYITSYRYPVEAIDVTAKGNTIRNQTGNPVFIYQVPYKAGNPFRMIDNDYRDSSVPLFLWVWDYYSGLGASYRPSENMGTIIVTGNKIANMVLGTQGALRLTGRVTLSNNTWDDINGWALIVEYMSKVPPISSGTALRNVTNAFWFAPIVPSGLVQTVTFSDFTIQATGTAIKLENANLILTRMDFGKALYALDIKGGHADIYSSNLPVLSAKVSSGASVDAYNEIGFAVTWADANGVDSGVPVGNAAVVTTTVNHDIVRSGRADAMGIVAPRSVLVWSSLSSGSAQVNKIYAPFEVLISAGGITQTVIIPQLGPGETISTFKDYPAYPTLLIDDLVPTIIIGAPAPGSTLGSLTNLFEGYTFERGSGVSLLRIKVDGGQWVDLPLTSLEAWKQSMSVTTQGQHTIYGEAGDRAGNRYATQVSFFVDITPPVLTLRRPMQESTLTNKGTYVVQGHVESPQSAVDVNGVPVSVTGRGDFFLEYPLLEGLNVLFITAADEAGNTVTVVRSITYDAYSPFLQVLSPLDGTMTNQKTIDISGRAEPGAVVTANDHSVIADLFDGSFVLQRFTLEDLFEQTENTISIYATDAAGNVAYDNRTVVVDTRAPQINLELDPALAARINAGRPVSVTSLDVKGRTDSTDAALTIAGQKVPLTGLSFSRTIVLAEGPNTIELKAADSAGNVRTVVLKIVRDTAKPTLTIERPTSLAVLTNERTLEVRGWTNSEGATVTLSYTNDHGVLLADEVSAVAVGVPIQYRFEHLIVLVPDGNIHSIEVKVVDAAGNAETQTITYTAKVTAPFLQLHKIPETVTETFVWVNGTTDPGVTKVTINGQTFPVEDQFFTVRWNLPVTQGVYTFRVSVSDSAGNLETANATVTVAVPQAVRTQSTASGVSTELLLGTGLALIGASVAVLAFALARRKYTRE